MDRLFGAEPAVASAPPAAGGKVIVFPRRSPERNADKNADKALPVMKSTLLKD